MAETAPLVKGFLLKRTMNCNTEDNAVLQFSTPGKE